MPSQPDLTATHAALADAQRVREQYRRMPACNPERREAIHAALDSLRDAWGAEHEAYMRAGSRSFRSISTDPVHIAQRERRAEMKRLRSMLNPTSGTPREEPEAVSAKAMQGVLSQYVQALRDIDTRHRALRASGLLGRGTWVPKGEGGFWTMQPLREEARELLDELRRRRARVNVQWDRYCRTRGRSYADQDAYDALEARLNEIRPEVKALTARLVATSQQRKPHMAPRIPGSTHDGWSESAIRAALHFFRAEHGRLPTKRELNSTPGLPHYTTCRRKLGPSPLSRFQAA